MGQQNDTGVLTLLAGEALEPHRAVKLSGSTARTVVYADQGDVAIGVTRDRVAIGAQIDIDALNKPGSVQLEATKAITVNADVYIHDDGKITDNSSGAYWIGKALVAAEASGEIIEVLTNAARQS